MCILVSDVVVLLILVIMALQLTFAKWCFEIIETLLAALIL